MEVFVSSSQLNEKTATVFDIVDQEKLQSHLKESLTKIITDEGFSSFKLETNAIESSGGNYLGELFVAQIKGNTEKGYKEINLFMKAIVPISSNLDFLSIETVYLREIFVYTELNAMFDELQTEAKVPDTEKFKLVKFYDTGNKKAIIMEDLTTKGFAVPERLKLSSLSYCEEAIKSLARFHSLSFVMNKERPAFYEKEIKPKKYLVGFNDTWHRFLDNMAKNAVEVLKSDEAKEIVQKYLSSVNLRDRYEYYYTTKNIGAFCHGDYRNQNIMMREKDGVVMEIMPLDYQLAHYGDPIIDLMYFITGTTDQTFRKMHMNDLKNLYYDTMENYLKYFDINIGDFYPRKQYEQDFNERLDFGILISLYHMTFMFAPENDFPDLSMDLITKKFAYTDIYIRCVNELVDDLIKWGHL